MDYLADPVRCLQAATSTATGPATPEQSKDQAAATDAGKKQAPVKGLPDLGKPRRKADKAADKADKPADGTTSQPSLLLLTRLREPDCLTCLPYGNL